MSISLLGLFLKMECLHLSRYKFKIETLKPCSLLEPKKGHWLLKNPDPLQNLKDSDVTRCGSGSDTVVEHGLEKTFFLYLTQIFTTVI
jgi:hypothetical protein